MASGEHPRARVLQPGRQASLAAQQPAHLRLGGVAIAQQDVVQPRWHRCILVHQVADGLQHSRAVVLLGLRTGRSIHIVFEGVWEAAWLACSHQVTTAMLRVRFAYLAAHQHVERRVDVLALLLGHVVHVHLQQRGGGNTGCWPPRGATRMAGCQPASKQALRTHTGRAGCAPGTARCPTPPSPCGLCPWAAATRQGAHAR